MASIRPKYRIIAVATAAALNPVKIQPNKPMAWMMKKGKLEPNEICSSGALVRRRTEVFIFIARRTPTISVPPKQKQLAIQLCKSLREAF
jgi:hypothetical protein